MFRRISALDWLIVLFSVGWVALTFFLPGL